MLYSVRMRAAQGGAHETGGRHISGAERLVRYDKVNEIANAMMLRAFTHSRGKADFINIKVEAIHENDVVQIPLLPVRTASVPNVALGRSAAKNSLIQTGVSPTAAEKGMAELLALKDSMRGAMLVCAKTGQRLDRRENRGIRVSRMDVSDDDGFTWWLKENDLSNVHVREALVLAAKVAFAPGMVAELCWSDDPDYTTGYVASKKEYIRFPHLKPYGSPVGGRVFFIEPDIDINGLLYYLEHQPALVTAPLKDGE